MQADAEKILLRVTTNKENMKFLCPINKKGKVQSLIHELETYYCQIMQENEENVGKVILTKLTKNGFYLLRNQIIEDVLKDEDEINCTFVVGSQEQKKSKRQKMLDKAEEKGLMEELVGEKKKKKKKRKNKSKEEVEVVEIKRDPVVKIEGDGVRKIVKVEEEI